MPRTARFLTAPLLALLTCACQPEPVRALRPLGSLRADVELAPHIAAVRLDLFDGEGLVETAFAEPAPLDRPEGAMQSAYVLFAVPPGPHRVIATPLGDDDRPAEGCAPDEATTEVVPMEVAEVVLRPPCETVTPLAVAAR